MSDYFSALLRAAGAPLRARDAARGASERMRAAPSAAAGSADAGFDPFDDALGVGALPAPDEGHVPQPVAAADILAADATRQPDRTPTDAPPASRPAPAHPAPLPALGRHAPPSVQAALRWVAAGVANTPDGAAPAATAPPGTAVPGTAPGDGDRPASQLSLGSATAQAQRRTNDANERSVVDAPDTPRASRVARSDAATQHAAQPARTAPQPLAVATRNGRDTQHPAAWANAAPQRHPGAATAPAQVHIGTLHVTLDAAATARFAAKAAPPAAAAPANPAPRNNDARHTRPGHTTSSASALSRSRLPRF